MSLDRAGKTGGGWEEEAGGYASLPTHFYAELQEKKETKETKKEFQSRDY